MFLTYFHSKSKLVGKSTKNFLNRRHLKRIGVVEQKFDPTFQTSDDESINQPMSFNILEYFHLIVKVLLSDNLQEVAQHLSPKLIRRIRLINDHRYIICQRLNDIHQVVCSELFLDCREVKSSDNSIWFSWRTLDKNVLARQSWCL